jgi:hypothetical protein
MMSRGVQLATHCCLVSILMWPELHFDFSHMPKWRGQGQIYLIQSLYSLFYTYYLFLVYRLFIVPIGVLNNILFINESNDRMNGHSELEKIRKREVTYRGKQKPGTSRDQGRVAAPDRSHSVQIE